VGGLRLCAPVYLMLFPVTVSTLAFCLIWASRRGETRSALMVGLGAWAAQLLLIAMPLFDYAVAYSVTTDVFVAACLLASTASYLLLRSRRGGYTPPLAAIRSSVRLARILATVGIVGGILLLLEAQRTGTELSVVYLLENLTRIRSSMFDDLAYRTAPSQVAIAGSYLSSFSLLAGIATAHLGRQAGRGTVALTGAALALLAVSSLFLYGGRATIFYAISLIILSFFLSRRRIVRLTLTRAGLAAVALGAAWYFATEWVLTREQNDDVPYIMMATQRASFDPRIDSLVRGNRSAETALLSLGYFASPLPTLTFYLEQSPLPGPFLGAYSYPLPARVVNRFMGSYDGDQWLETRSRVFAPLESRGYAGNVWATWLRDLIVDFGYAGALIYCGAFAAFMAWSRNLYERTGEIHYHFLEVLACFTFAFGAFQNVLWFTTVATAFFAAAFLALAAWAQRGRFVMRLQP
jgi:hypothetical protein